MVHLLWYTLYKNERGTAMQELIDLFLSLTEDEQQKVIEHLKEKENEMQTMRISTQQ